MYAHVGHVAQGHWSVVDEVRMGRWKGWNCLSIRILASPPLRRPPQDLEGRIASLSCELEVDLPDEKREMHCRDSHAGPVSFIHCDTLHFPCRLPIHLGRQCHHL